MARVSIQEEDWANAVTYAEKGRALVKELEGDRGIQLEQCVCVPVSCAGLTHFRARASLETALGVALVPYFSPKHHPRATRLLNAVLTAQPSNAEARFARAQIFQTAGNWREARKHFQQILDQGGEEKEMVAAREEVAWCLVNEGSLEEGRDILEGVVELRDERKETSGKDDEPYARARAWWRLGRTEWMIGGECGSVSADRADAESKEHAEDWFMASIRALPTFAPAYTSLGICYTDATPPDEERAQKCFQKAFELDATEADAARRLATGYADDDEWALVRAIATRVMEGEGGVDGVAGGEVMNAKGRFAPKNGWAWKALGSTEMVRARSCLVDIVLPQLCQSRASLADRSPRRARGHVHLAFARRVIHQVRSAHCCLESFAESARTRPSELDGGVRHCGHSCPAWPV